MFRSIQRSPASYVTAGLTLAVGIGAVVAMFSIFSAVVLRPMNVDRPAELVDVQTTNAAIPNVPVSLSWVRFDSSLRHARSFSHVAAWDFDSIDLTPADGPPEQLNVLRVSGDFFGALQVAAAAGRLFTAQDDVPNGPDVCVLSHEFWTSRFGGATMVGRTIPLNGRPVEVVGILPPRFTRPWSAVSLILPRVFETSTMLPENIRGGSSYLSVLGRLGPGVAIEQAQSELDGLAREYTANFAGRTDAANGTRAVRFVETLAANQRQTMVNLLTAVSAVLLVACANASTLFLGRLLARQRETAVRQALGASRTRIITEFLFESLALSLLAGLAGLAVAWGLIRIVTALAGSALPQAVNISIDVTAVAVAVGVVVLSALLVGFMPAWYVTRPVMAPLLTFARGDTGTPSGRRVRALLVMGEVALSCVLLICAGLLVTSLQRLQRTSPGFEVGGAAAGSITLPQARYSRDQQAAFATAVVDRLERAGEVRGAAAVFGLPLGPGFSFHQYVIAGEPVPPPSERQRAGIRLVTEDYFDVMGIRLKAGRLFTEHDRAGTPNVCIINESLARRMFSGNAVGESVLRGRDADTRYEIVGIVEDIRTYGVQRPSVDEIFYPMRQLPWPQFSIVARTDGNPSSLRTIMEGAMREIDPTLPLAGFTSMQELFDRSTGTERTMTSISAAFAAIATLMALIGLYAVLAQSVASRSTEISVRIALGADRRRIIGLVLLSGMSVIGAGIGAGVLTAALGSRYLASQLYQVNPRDPMVFGGVAVLFAGVAFLACLAPSWRAARLDPMNALRKV